MDKKGSAGQVLIGLALLFATASAFLAITLIWRAHAPAVGPAASAISAKQPPDLSAYLPTPSEYPPGFTTPPENGIAMPRLASPVGRQDRPAAAPCDFRRGIQAQPPPTGDSPPQLHLVNFKRTGGSVLSIAVMEAGDWKDLSTIRTQLTQCPEYETGDITCADTAHQPIPAVPADDVIAIESRCQSSFNYQFLTYYAVIHGYVVYIIALGNDPRPAESVLEVVVNKVRSGADTP
ncbi:hypothetical protein [Mycobacteroides abscessus]|uniref:hypothetical protein n=2 Tax=Mycobacteroides abscessus TaxID=36809 RepID=UPI0004742CF0|nr:hypothetical protein [Mycobacteroides abscessus]MBE5441421.1 hypothetical protein [Mycobacteroides abscessus]RIU17659.1 hypothetical protein D2E97_06580 [Mycobacteroides abscessus]SIC89414.1 Uncharacterised protein [Mycobacteroides abscessus subsp. abscessus]SIG92727.1 Uncharacterised protein [Mycobacteroides abscessus subsp. abscessus]SIL25357.1 Uncharacterised protein [Mycobacteroides abscessus subsp. abscessus]